ncbi:NADPH-dependent FMN reductase [Ligilactobacillus agilis]|uniref:NADPH-dependent FMN reductase n=1 Tax=Ligilactobacillus agilis TaxID=1601 RepID=UPI0019580C87|nr:NADPH-dependent FMN reductase [Ligilactobacillus agilis]MBM6763703.1 NAD(P)H-dependent oxidoreductase [Ligilactobacillus agilis]
MKIVALAGSVVGKKTLTVMNYVAQKMATDFSEIDFELIELAQKDIQFSDGRNYLEYSGDTLEVTTKIMAADALIIGTPIFQAAIPGSVKNIFDLLPEKALRDKVVSLVITAGSPEHYLVAEMQLKPILAYMKAQVLPEIVFVEGQDLYRNEIINHDIIFRLDKLVEDTVLMVETFKILRQKQEDALF